MRFTYYRQAVQTALLILSLTVLNAACSTVPITGRSQLLLVSNQQLAAQYDGVAQAVVDRARADGTLMLASDSEQSARTLERIHRVASRMLTAAGLRNASSRPVNVIRQPVENAFVSPSGTIVIFAGLLEVADSEAMLAAVIGHEIGHVVAEHAGERASHRLLAELTIRLAVSAIAAKKPEYAPIAALGLGLGAQYAVLLPFSREHESEADLMGMTWMAKAGYDPNEAVRLWDRMARSGSRRPEFLSTHPAPETRRNDLQRVVANLMPEFRRANPAANEDLKATALVAVFPGSRTWWNEMNAIIDARIQGSINETEADRLQAQLMRRTVDMSYRGLRDQPTQGNEEFWDQVLRLQEERRAGRIAVWDVETKIQELAAQTVVSKK